LYTWRQALQLQLGKIVKIVGNEKKAFTFGQGSGTILPLDLGHRASFVAWLYRPDADTPAG